MPYDSLEDVLSSVGPGWRGLVEPLWRLCQVEDVDIMQVKEKFGGLRFYVGPAPAYVQELIEIVEGMSYRVCEVCGTRSYITDEKIKTGLAKEGWQDPRVATRDAGGWLRTLCLKHHEEIVAAKAAGDV